MESYMYDASGEVEAYIQHLKRRYWKVLNKYLLCFWLVPESYEEFQSLLSEKPTDQQLIVLERIQKCNHPSLAQGNKAKLEVRDETMYVS